MPKHLVTQCPSCQTRFQLSHAQLQAADGIVRCGKCEAIFSANRHLETPAMPLAEESSNEPRLTETAAPQLTQEPIRLTRRSKRSPLAATLWTIAALGMSLLAIGQIGWYERDRLSKDPQLAPLYQQLCQRIDCQLSAPSDLNAIRSDKLLIRDHPRYQQALQLDLLLENRAPFEQPFPALKLVFLTLSGKPTAARIVQPTTYLGGEFAQRALMPTNKSVQIQLELQAPSEPSPGYRLELIPASPTG